MTRSSRRQLTRWSLISAMASAALFAGSIPAFAAQTIPNPPANVQPTFSTLCQTAGAFSPACQSAIVQRINGANQAEHGEAIHLPPGFSAMSATTQLFVLTNLERLSFGLQPVTGLNATISANAAQAAAQHTDPTWMPSVDGATSYQMGGNWAGIPSPLESDFFWMYDDGPGSGNLACQPGHMTGCWGHRENILMRFSNLTWPSYFTAEGTGAAPGSANENPSYTLSLYALSQPVPLTLTWSHILSLYPAGQSPVTPFSSSSTPTARGPYLGQVAGQPTVYEVQGGERHPIPDPAILAAMQAPGTLPWVTWSTTPNLPVGIPAIVPFPSGTLIRAAGQAPVYLVEDGVLHHVASLAALKALGRTLNQVVSVSSISSVWPQGLPVNSPYPTYFPGELMRVAGFPTVYLVSDNALHAIATASQFQAMDGTYARVAVISAQSPGYPRGAALTAAEETAWATDGTLVRQAGQAPVYLVADGQLRHVVSPAVLQALDAPWSSVQVVATLPALPPGPALS